VAFNAGKRPGPEPTRIVLDLEALRGHWHSAENIEEVAW
jgi:hypothetical protein